MLLVFVSSPSFAQSFDLVCQGTRQTEVNGPESPHNYGFRIDLSAKRWCWDHCERTFSMHEIAPERLVLLSEQKQSGSNRTFMSNEINRLTGEHEMVSISTGLGGSYFRIVGRCERRPFSGFPKPNF
ncbi:MAG: hypothetical protein O9253_02285 [Aquidulcibacter sp.]|nr:hypothetical protein [Aquidulcibacter sp.]